MMDSENKKISPFSAIVIILNIILIIVIIIMIVGFLSAKNQDGPKPIGVSSRANIVNLPVLLKNVNKYDAENIAFSVYDAVRLNSEKISGNVSAKILPDSIQNTNIESKSFNILNFVVDVDDFDEDFIVTYMYLDDGVYDANFDENYRIMTYCRDNQNGCKDRYAGRAKEIIDNIIK